MASLKEVNKLLRSIKLGDIMTYNDDLQGKLKVVVVGINCGFNRNAKKAKATITVSTVEKLNYSKLRKEFRLY